MVAEEAVVAQMLQSVVTLLVADFEQVLVACSKRHNNYKPEVWYVVAVMWG